MATTRWQTLHQRLSQQHELLTESILSGEHAIQLFRPAHPDQLLDRMLEQPEDHIDIRDERLPYWAELWPSSLAMAEFLSRASFLSPTTEVLELGCGLGLAGVAAGLVTPHVTMTDYQPAALEFAELNWLNNRDTPFRGQLLDWREPRPELAADVVLAADVAYESRSLDPLVHAFRTLTRPGGWIVLTEPGRKVARGFAEKLADRLNTPLTSSTIAVTLDGLASEVDLHVMRG